MKILPSVFIKIIFPVFVYDTRKLIMGIFMTYLRDANEKK